MIYPADTPAFHGAPRRHRGWMVMPHAVERFRSRVANVRHDEATAWLTEHAHEAINTGQRTLRGDRIYRLAHPWPGPDAAFVVKVDPDHTRVVVTCGWWDELATDDDTPATRDDLPEARRGLQPRHARTTLEERVAVILDAPRPPDGLPCPPGSLDLSAILPGYSLDTDALSRADLARWVDYARLVKIHLANSGHGTAAALAKQVESSLRQCAHERLILEQKAAAMRARHNLRAAPPVDLTAVNDAAARPLLVALCAALRDVYGDSACEVLLAEAGRRVGQHDPSMGGSKVMP